ncbi:MAG: hypothetical protein OJF52_003946 [Nitrospira sp.]|jgi:hypothetical protein|nr:MAG: hypothetical protein OJF52_003946 [Nitrospira sp.]
MPPNNAFELDATRRFPTPSCGDSPIYRIYRIVFDWHIAKAIANFEKHGVPFEEAATVFGDANALDWQDLNHSQQELHSSGWVPRSADESCS